NAEARIVDAGADNPKVNLLLSPGAGLIFRLGYATSFRVASLSQSGSAATALLTALPNRSGAEANTLYITGANPSLRPEFAKSFTLAVDYSPSILKGTSLTVTYF